MATENQNRTSERGFASMSEEARRAIAREGGRAAHQKGTAHEWDSKEAAAAGSKGGRASHRGGKASSSSSAQTGSGQAGSQQPSTNGQDALRHESQRQEGDNRRGFGSMEEEEQQEIGGKGG